MNRKENYKEIKIDERTKIVCWGERERFCYTRRAELVQDGSVIAKTAANYYGGTREKYEYQVVIRETIDRSNLENKQAVKELIEKKLLKGAKQ